MSGVGGGGSVDPPPAKKRRLFSDKMQEILIKPKTFFIRTIELLTFVLKDTKR